jgi:flagellar protein FliO/FliZ
VSALPSKESLRTPRAKLLVASALLLLLALVTPAGSLSVVGVARALLALALLAGAAWWMARRRAPRQAFRLRAPLEVLSRQGLSPRCSVALLQADGQRFLITYGDGFAQIRPMASRKHSRSRRAAGQRSTPASGVLQ